MQRTAAASDRRAGGEDFMDWSDNAEQAAFRAKVRAVIEHDLPERYQDGDGDWERDRKNENPVARDAAKQWTDALAKQGWVAPHWPKEYGGAGLSPMEQFIFKQEMAISGAPPVGGQGVSQLGPTLIVHGSDEQKAEHLPKILSGEVDWRQGYSEPGAGSDLASLQTRAIRDGDEYVINGQKIWTSLAHHADWLYVLTRTDPDAPKHRGISFLLMDKHTPGITIRPLIDMSGRHHFNESFFEDVRVPVSNRVGEENRGWYVGMTLLDFERSNITGAVSARRTLDALTSYLKTDDGKSKSPGAEANRLGLADRYIETEVMFNFSFRIISMQDRGLIPNHEASVSKLFASEMSQRIANTGTRVFGLYSNIHDRQDKRSAMESRLTSNYLTSVSATIAAGTSEIQRNIIATRGLGLPRG
jgi:alkylation response protein AidB-like acyl-CoA dehydrogenase